MPSAHFDLALHAWSLPNLGEAIEMLAQRANLVIRQPESNPKILEKSTEQETIQEGVASVAQAYGIEAEPFEINYSEVEIILRQAGPALLQLPEVNHTMPYFIALVAGGRGKASLLCPDGKVCQFSISDMRQLLCSGIERPYLTGMATLLERLGIAEDRREKVGTAIVAEQLRQQRVTGGWLFRPSPYVPLWKQALNAGLLRLLIQLLALQLIIQGLMVLSWWLVGRGVILGGLQGARLSAWGLLVFTMIPFQLLGLWLQSRLAAGWGALFKQRLLYGSLKLHPDEIRHQGMGQFLARVMDSSAVEQITLQGGLAAILALVNLITAFSVLGLGVAGLQQVGVFLIWVLMTIFLSWRYYAYHLGWSDHYRKMTDALVEKMVGHRSRLAQEAPSRWHIEEDTTLDRYLNLSTRLDRSIIPVMTIPFSWTIVGLAILAMPLATGEIAPGLLAVSLGGILLGSQALSGIVGGVQSLASLVVAWKQVGPLFRAAARPEDAPIHYSLSHDYAHQGALLTAREISYRFYEHGRMVLDGINLQIDADDRILLEGPSGGGKSTLAAVLCGLRRPESGMLLLRGYDRQSIGESGWRRNIVVAPQFHENHIFTETLGFNLLMGRRYPPTPEDLQEAEEICQELGLRELIERMPSGIQQMVGESGWQLSHGEKSRIFIARALLQNSNLMIFDESFGALDPENLERALNCVIKRAPSLLVIAHP